MDTSSKEDMQKAAQWWRDALNGITSGTKATPGIAAWAGMTGGVGLGALLSMARSKNPDIETARRKALYYRRKVEELENERWLDEIMTLKKKLDSSRLEDAERADLESKYLKLINK